MSEPLPGPDEGTERGAGRGLVAGVVGGLLILALVGWGLRRSMDPVVSDAAPPEAARSEPEPREAEIAVAEDGPLIPEFKLLGNSPAPAERDRCSEEARAAMEAFGTAKQGGDIAVREAEWRDSATLARVGVASWFSECTRDGRAVRIVGESSGEVLAEYHPRLGYREPREPDEGGG